MSAFLFGQQVTLLRPVDSGSKDRLGRPIYNYVPAGVKNCRKETVNPREIPTEVGKTEIVDTLFFFREVVPVQSRWRLQMNGQQYEVMTVDSPQSGYSGPHHTEILAKIVGFDG